MARRCGRIFRWLPFVLAVTLAAACGGSEPVSSPTDVDAMEGETSLKLYVFDCGRLRFDTVANFSIEDDETDVRELVVPCYIVDHPDGRMLWDGGLPSYVADTDGWHANARIGGRTARLDRTLPEQLTELDLGFDLSSLDYMAFSHIHYDHVGVANEVTGATWLCVRLSIEWRLSGECGDMSEDSVQIDRFPSVRKITRRQKKKAQKEDLR